MNKVNVVLLKKEIFKLVELIVDARKKPEVLRHYYKKLEEMDEELARACEKAGLSAEQRNLIFQSQESIEVSDEELEALKKVFSILEKWWKEKDKAEVGILEP